MKILLRLILLLPALALADIESDISKNLPLQTVFKNALEQENGDFLKTAQLILSAARPHSRALLIILFKHKPSQLRDIIRLALKAGIHASIVMRAAMEALPHKLKQIENVALEAGVPPELIAVERLAFTQEERQRIQQNAEIKAKRPPTLEPSNRNGGSGLASPN